MNAQEDRLLDELRLAADRLSEAHEEWDDTVSIARQMGLPESDIEKVRRAAGLYAR